MIHVEQTDVPGTLIDIIDLVEVRIEKYIETEFEKYQEMTFRDNRGNYVKLRLHAQDKNVLFREVDKNVKEKN